MFIKMNYEMFSNELPEFTEEQKQIMWKYYERVEDDYRNRKLIFNSEVISSDWEIHKDITDLYTKFRKVYPVEKWAKDNAKQLIEGEKLSYKDSFIDAMRWNKNEVLFALSDGGYMVFRTNEGRE